MKKITYVLLIILFASFFQLSVSCFGDPSGYYWDVWTSWIGCVFYGDCEDWFSFILGGTGEAKFAAYGNNDGQSLNGSWKLSEKEVYFILAFEENGTLSLAQYKTSDNSVIRYDRGKYSTEDNNLIIDMENGTFSVVQYSISNGMLKLQKAEEKEEVVQTTE